MNWALSNFQIHMMSWTYHNSWKFEYFIIRGNYVNYRPVNKYVPTDSAAEAAMAARRNGNDFGEEFNYSLYTVFGG